MNSQSRLLNSLLKFYPDEYRSNYQDEMLYTADAMLAATNTKRERNEVIRLLIKDYVKSLIKQLVLDLDRQITARPRYIRRSSLLASALAMPFISICALNMLYQKLLHKEVPIMHLESKTYAIYCVILPSVAFLIVVGAALRRTYKLRRSSKQKLSYDALLLGVPLTLLTTIALL